MTNVLYRFLISILGLAPMSLAFFVASHNNDQLSIIYVGIGFIKGCFICLVACLFLKIIIRSIARGSPIITIQGTNIKGISQNRGGLTPYFLSYIIPLFLSDAAKSSFWIFCIISLLIASLFSSGVYNNPIFSFLRYKFYNIELNSGINLLYITKESPQEIIDGLTAIVYEDDVIIQR